MTPQSARAVARFSPPAIHLSPGSLEGLKWLGLILMTVDHANKHLLGGSSPELFAAGRSALPLFCFVLAYNLSRPTALLDGAYRRTAYRLCLWGTAASVPFVGLGGLGWGWWPLNIMFTLCVATACAWLIELGGFGRYALATTLFITAGAFVEFWWPGVGLCLAAWAYFRRPSWTRLALCFLALASLYAINRNFWSFASIAFLVFASYTDLRIPRAARLFYWYYPAHLGALWVAATILGTKLN